MGVISNDLILMFNKTFKGIFLFILDMLNTADCVLLIISSFRFEGPPFLLSFLPSTPPSHLFADPLITDCCPKIIACPALGYSAILSHWVNSSQGFQVDSEAHISKLTCSSDISAGLKILRSLFKI